MLKRLTLENIAIIDEAVAEFKPGMTVITGETGSGKSLLLDGIALVFGAKASPKDVIRQGQDKAQVELLLALSKHVVTKPAFQQLMTTAGLDEAFDTESEFLLTREFTSKGSRSRINGTPVSRDVMEKLRPLLVDLHGQHELTNLFECDCQRDYLDGLGDKKFLAIKEEVLQTYQQYQKVKTQLDQMRNHQQQWIQQRDFLQFQCQELLDANLNDTDEDQQLQTARQRLAYSEQIKQNSQEASYWLSSDSPILDGFYKLQKLLTPIAEHDPKLESFLETATGLYEEARQLGGQISRYSEGVDDDPSQLNEIISRLDQLERLKRKYGPSLPEVLATRQRLQCELQNVINIENDSETLQATLDHLEGQLQTLSDKLSEQRKKLAKRLEAELLQELKQLSLPAVRFEVGFEQAVFSHNGYDHITFLFSANPGEPLRPLAKVASGGELSRVLLALKVITAAQEGVSTLIFDEIDTGISGATAKAVSEKLYQLSQQVQVLVITHQPVIAAMANHHWHVEKTIHAKSVTVDIKPLHKETEKLLVLSRMIDGTDQAVSMAKQLRNQRKETSKA